MSFHPNTQQLWLIQRLMAQQQKQQSLLQNPIVSLAVNSVAAPVQQTTSKTNRIAELIFSPNKAPKSYAEKLGKYEI